MSLVSSMNISLITLIKHVLINCVMPVIIISIISYNGQNKIYNITAFLILKITIFLKLSSNISNSNWK